MIRKNLQKQKALKQNRIKRIQANKDKKASNNNGGKLDENQFAGLVQRSILPKVTDTVKKTVAKERKKNDHGYYSVLVNPFSQKKCGIPNSARYGKTYTFQRVSLASYTPNANGDMFLQWKPRAVGNNLTTTASCLLIDNSANYNPVSPTVGVSPIFNNPEIGWDAANVKTVSLVSAGLKIYFENPATVLQPKGRIFVARENELATPYSGTVIAPQAGHTLSFVISNKEHREYKNSNMTQIEMVYLPSSYSSLDMTTAGPTAGYYISDNEKWTNDPSDEFTAIFTRFDVGTQIYVELFYTYEAVVLANGNYRDLPEYNCCFGLDLACLAGLRTTGMQIRQEPISSDHTRLENMLGSMGALMGYKNSNITPYRPLQQISA